MSSGVGGGLWLTSGHVGGSTTSCLGSHGTRSVATGAHKSEPSPPAKKKVKVALCQMLVGKDKATNIKVAREAIEKAAKQGAEIVSLPGTASLMRIHNLGHTSNRWNTDPSLLAFPNGRVLEQPLCHFLLPCLC